MKSVTGINKMKPGGLIIIDDVPCKITKTSKSKSGKHGASKIRIDAVGILNGKTKSLVKPSSENVYVPILNKLNGQILSISGSNAQLMDMTSYEVFELPIPEELMDKLKEGEEIQYYEVLGTKTLKKLKWLFLFP